MCTRAALKNAFWRRRECLARVNLKSNYSELKLAGVSTVDQMGFWTKSIRLFFSFSEVVRPGKKSRGQIIFFFCFSISIFHIYRRTPSDSNSASTASVSQSRSVGINCKSQSRVNNMFVFLQSVSKGYHR